MGSSSVSQAFLLVDLVHSAYFLEELLAHLAALADHKGVGPCLGHMGVMTFGLDDVAQDLPRGEGSRY